MSNIVYFFSILINLIAGIYLISEFAAKRTEVFEPLASGLKNNKIYGYIFIALIFAIAILKLFVVVPEFVEIVSDEKKVAFTRKAIPIIGDLFPFIAGLVAGMTILFDFIFDKGKVEVVELMEDEVVDVEDAETDEKENNFNKVGVFLTDIKTITGFTVIVISVLHIFFAGVILL